MIRLDRKKHTLDYQPGDTILEAARRGGLAPAVLVRGGQLRHVHGACRRGIGPRCASTTRLSAEEVDDGWVLTCQAIPTSREVVVNYDA